MRVILIGGSKTVYYLARQLKAQEHHVTIIDDDVVRCNELYTATNATVVHGNGSSKRTLESAGARQADAVLALTEKDPDNLITCQIAQQMYGVPHVIALVNDPDNEDTFKQLGIQAAFSATRVIAQMIEQRTAFEDITELMPLAGGKVQVSDVRLDRDSPAVGKTLSQLDLSDQTLIACIIRDEEVIVPRGNNQLHAGDHVLVISKHGYKERDLERLTGDSVP